MTDENLLSIAAVIEADNATRDECETLRAQLAAEQAAHALTRETYETGARMNAAKVAELRASLGELCAAVVAERQRENDLEDGGGRRDWQQWRLAQAATDAIVERLAPEAATDATDATAHTDAVAELRASIAQLIDGHNAVMNAGMAWENDKDNETETIAMFVAADEMSSLITRLAPEAVQDAN